MIDMKDKLNPKGRIHPLYHGTFWRLRESKLQPRGLLELGSPNSSAARTPRENNSSDHFGSAAARRSADMAVQHRLGLLPEWWLGIGTDHCRDFGLGKKNLAIDTSSPEDSRAALERLGKATAAGEL
jgi:hypothetical protein